MKNKSNYLIIFFISLFVIGLLLFLFREKLLSSLFTPRQAIPTNGTKLISKESSLQDTEVVAQNLDIPWEIAFLQSGDLLVTERSGKLLKIGSETKVIKEIEGVRHVGEGGLLGLTLHPNFSVNNFIYLYSTTQDSNGISNRVERYRFSNDTLSERKVILEKIKGSSNHDGGRIAFGPDGYLYITTGDAETPNLAQDKNSLNGKILRIKDDGGIPEDNPFGNAVYSLGHRNPQGLAWDKNGTLWETEHGPSGIQTGNDEVNIIIKGGNYGWPTIKGDQTKKGLISPIIQSGTKDTWAPSGMAYYDGSLFFSGLRGEALYEAKIRNGNKLDLLTHFKQEFGRIRAVVLGPDGYLYLSTSNQDGRGRVREGDDKIIKINPKIFR
ncbi:TPA: glucose sorbosone dehydrogenase [Candidatus Collierbacteria bacterium]|uniref:Quinoprotein glucose dehydrogenase n=1 Tax=Candidatus Collierbacteria bacterium GW2011_GWA2_42_17 TaxID=1618378 RepID=A0A0G0Z3F6_9BACT|nr:MAG: Quinoprotein glucose dehydrogenase [Candidatus Collierbacteria bacterium GW2011_GWA2_42_17]HAN22254.1 glucose sorbosone dehydrogenase [Candidatus Collierbacteria bacterium]HBX64367.1 glucose sorbosone dehydrogenase [Candidatus Collierbacteria bacterium]